MTLLNTIPLIGAIVAFLLGLIILTNKSQNRAARTTLSLIVFLSAHNLLESYLYYNDLSWPGLGLSYLHYHLIGALFLLYTHFLFRVKVNLKLWGMVLVLYTIARLVILDFVDEDVLSATSFTPEIVGFAVDYFVSVLLNMGLLFLAFLKIKKVRFIVKLTNAEKLRYQWLKSLLIISIALYVIVFISGAISIFDENQWLIYLKIESAFISLFALSIAYSTMRFPVFSVYGDFQDLPVGSRKKYAKSSLTKDTLNSLWKELNKVMKEEKPYLNPEYRLNDLAARVERSVHHVSQVINEKEGISFSDFVNRFRIEDAKHLLSSGRADQVTILAISYEAGFNSKTAFYNTFKKVTGMTPSNFLRKRKQA